jgi:hypothetical protein
VGPTDTRAALVAALIDAGIRATGDPARLNPPDIAVLVEDVNLTAPLVPRCSWNATITVWLCAPAAGAVEALAQLEALLVDVAKICNATTARHTVKDHGSTSWTAYQLTVPTTID